MIKAEFYKRIFLGFLLLGFQVCANAQDFSPQDGLDQSMLNQQVDGLSIAVDDVAKDIESLKQDLLFPPITRLQVYVSLATDVIYDLHSVSLSINGVEKSFHIYSERDISALRLGGVQRFWEGNVTLGEQKVSATFIGLDAKQQPLKRTLRFSFTKALSGHAIELAVVSQDPSKKPDFLVKDWGEQ